MPAHPDCDGWVKFWTGEKHSGESKVVVTPPLHQVPLFVKQGALLARVRVTLNTGDPAAVQLTVRKRGNASRPCVLYEDDGSVEPVFTRFVIEWKGSDNAGAVTRSGPTTSTAHAVEKWELIA